MKNDLDGITRVFLIREIQIIVPIVFYCIYCNEKKVLILINIKKNNEKLINHFLEMKLEFLKPIK